jgi:hypothetical protein
MKMSEKAYKILRDTFSGTQFAEELDVKAVERLRKDNAHSRAIGKSHIYRELFHYTSLDAFTKILKLKEKKTIIRATEAGFLNDSLEMKKIEDAINGAFHILVEETYNKLIERHMQDEFSDLEAKKSVSESSAYFESEREYEKVHEAKFKNKNQKASYINETNPYSCEIYFACKKIQMIIEDYNWQIEKNEYDDELISARIDERIENSEDEISEDDSYELDPLSEPFLLRNQELFDEVKEVIISEIKRLVRLYTATLMIDEIDVEDVKKCTSKYYVVSLSRDEDALPMWLYYAKSHGICVKIDFTKIDFGDEIRIGDIYYLEEEHNRITAEVFQSIINDVISKIDRYWEEKNIDKEIVNTLHSYLVDYYMENDSNDILVDNIDMIVSGISEKLFKENYNNYVDALHIMSYFLKDSSFRHEKEVRIIVKERKPLNFRCKDQYIIPYVEIGYPGRLPISGIVYSPLSRDNDIVEAGIRTILKESEYDEKLINIIPSSVSLRY